MHKIIIIISLFTIFYYSWSIFKQEQQWWWWCNSSSGEEEEKKKKKKKKSFTECPIPARFAKPDDNGMRPFENDMEVSGVLRRMLASTWAEFSHLEDCGNKFHPKRKHPIQCQNQETKISAKIRHDNAQNFNFTAQIHFCVRHVNDSVCTY